MAKKRETKLGEEQLVSRSKSQIKSSQVRPTHYDSVRLDPRSNLFPDSLERNREVNVQSLSNSEEIVVINNIAGNIKEKNMASLSLIHQNIQYLRNKIDRLEIFLKNEKPDLVVFTEHGLKSNEMSQINIPGFSMEVSFCRQQHKSGGVCIFTNNNSRNINSRSLTLVDQFSHEMDMEAVGLEVRLGNNTNIAIVGIYRSPNGEWDNFYNYFSRLLESLTERFIHVIVVGDFNVNLAIQSKMSEDFRDIIHMNNLVIKVEDYTRITSNSQTIIDNIITNVDSCQVRLGGSELSDHGYQVLEIEQVVSCNGPDKVFKETRQEESGNINCLKQYLLRENWENVYSAPDINKKYDNFINTLKFHYNKSCPLKKGYVKDVVIEGDHWISDDILKLRSEVRDAYSDFKSIRNTNNERRYRDMKKNTKKRFIKLNVKKLLKS